MMSPYQTHMKCTGVASGEAITQFNRLKTLHNKNN